MAFEVIRADYTHTQHADWLITLLDEYARDEQGGGAPLSTYSRENLIDALQQQPNAVSFFVLENGNPVALSNCFFGFSTFKCKPVLNIHDFMVRESHRGKGLSRLLLNGIEEFARHKGCCKITLEVLEGNTTAQQAYRNYGFAGYELDPKMGTAMFWELSLI
ncbi:GNAT family N-acetyltransferase [Aestuariibacter salexigens]|uniref:GNAT family N-acetyltransferase n=1 Tax=Aestuariibacter salexigens TaxID=226010 RepID=UPI00040DC609|nr:GNAT family N-acetyltransferase [Aestuariibacter salexigens]